MTENGMNESGRSAGVASSDMHEKMNAMTAHMKSHLSALEGDEFESAFLSLTIMHHQQMIEAGNIAAPKVIHPELRELIASAKADQGAEIEKIRNMQREWGYDSH